MYPASQVIFYNTFIDTFSARFAIGLDEVNKYVFFFRKTNDREIARHINLAGIEKCKAINTSRSIQRKEGEYKVVDRPYTPAL